MAEGSVIWTFPKRTERTKSDFLGKGKTLTVRYIDGRDRPRRATRSSRSPSLRAAI